MRDTAHLHWLPEEMNHATGTNMKGWRLPEALNPRQLCPCHCPSHFITCSKSKVFHHQAANFYNWNDNSQEDGANFLVETFCHLILFNDNWIFSQLQSVIFWSRRTYIGSQFIPILGLKFAIHPSPRIHSTFLDFSQFIPQCGRMKNAIHSFIQSVCLSCPNHFITSFGPST